MTTLFPEFENQNQLRRYPFAAGSVFFDTDGVALDTSAFVDAVVYPTNPQGNVRLSAIDYTQGIVEISDDSGVLATGQLGQYIKLYTVDDHIPCGSLVANVDFVGNNRREFEQLYFAAACVIPVNPSGVTGLRINGQILTGDITFLTGDHIWPLLSTEISEGVVTKATLSFKITPSTVSNSARGITKVYFYETKGTLFSISPYESDADQIYSVQMQLRGLYRDDICNAAHREDILDIYDTCEEEKCICSYEGNVIPASEDSLYTFDVVTSGKNAFSLVVPNTPIGVNPLNVQMYDSAGAAPSIIFSPSMTQEEAEAELTKLYNMDTSAHGLRIQIPGLEVK